MDMSSNLHAVRLHVEQGKRESANLGTQHLQKASLTTLEFSLPQIADRVCRTGDREGLMQRVSKFNNFLDRAATELEGRV